jgi:diaminopimelate epimerase
MTLLFVKMQGAGNDYIYVDATRHALPGDLPELARRMSDRHFGVGSDGLICILPPEPGVEAHLRMRMWNNDGSESEMCGNGIRCVAKLAWDDAIARHNPLKVQTGRGVLSIEMQVGEDGRVKAATVDMGAPLLEIDQIGVNLGIDGPAGVGAIRQMGEHRYAITTRQGVREATFVSMGNPHAVIYVDDLARVDLPVHGREIEHLPAFPRRMNVHFVQVVSPREIKVLHWERGTGATLACGTGACAVCVAGVLTGRTERQILAHVPGGELQLRWDAPGGHVFKTGEAVEVFRGVWP